MHGIEVLTLREGAKSFTAVSIVLGTANGRKNWSIPLCGNDSRFSLIGWIGVAMTHGFHWCGNDSRFSLVKGERKYALNQCREWRFVSV